VHAAQSVRLHVAFSPQRLGHGTTVEITTEILAPPGLVPSPLTGLDIRYPSELGVAVGGLGLSTCSQPTLERLGPEGCPASSRMGQGSALAEIAVGPDILAEEADVVILRAPEQEGHLALLFYLDGGEPVRAEIIFPGLLLSGPGPTEESIDINVPLVPSLPGSPFVAVVRLHATLGPRGLIYYERRHGKFVPYRPAGVLLPNKCPHGGFRFAATFAFLDGSSSGAQAVVPCRSQPRSKRRR